MDMIAEFLSREWTQALGWTLMHSLWQSGLILLLVLATLRFIPAAKSATRYALSFGGLTLLIASTFFTFFYINSHASGEQQTQAAIVYEIAFTSKPAADTYGVSDVVTLMAATIEHYMLWILAAWFAGFSFFALRFAGGLLVTTGIRNSSFPLANEWTAYIQSAGRMLGISRMISLSESGAITTPMVIGYFKPVILIPAGMLTGLSTEQLETIFLHELAHIRRHDYLINIIQSAVEAVLFFNPFVLSLSSLIRREREYCCDDLVLRHHGNASAYTHALAKLAENRLTAHAFVLSLGDDKNQLLNRIRRIMEKTVKNYSGKSRLLLPAMLLVAGGLCISWLGMEGKHAVQSDTALTEPDTAVRKKENGARYSRRSIITIDENGQPHEEVIEEFEGDEDLRPLLEKRMPSLPDISSIMPALPPHSTLPQMPANPSDTIPPAPFSFRDRGEWEEFSRTFEENFGRNFDTLFRFRGEDLSAFMEKLEERFGFEDWQQWSAPHFNFPPDAFDEPQQFFDRDSFEKMEEKLKRLRGLDFEHFKRNEGDSLRSERYEDVLREQLVEDGYLLEDESIESLEWSNDFLKVNGKKIEEDDEAKYRELNRRYFNRRPLDKLE